MRPIKLDIDPADVDPDGLAAGNSSAGATVTLDGALTSGGTFTSADGLGHRINITDAGASNQTTATYTVTGTDPDGRSLVEELTGPASTATVETVGYFLTVTSVTIASPVGGSTVDIGTVDEVSGQTIPINWRSGYGVNLAVDVTGTIDFTVQETFVPVQDVDQSRVWFDISALTAKTADTRSSAQVGATGVRFITNSYTNAAEAQVYMTQPDD